MLLRLLLLLLQISSPKIPSCKAGSLPQMKGNYQNVYNSLSFLPRAAGFWQEAKETRSAIYA